MRISECGIGWIGVFDWMLVCCVVFADFVETGHAPSPKRKGGTICGFVYDDKKMQ